MVLPSDLLKAVEQEAPEQVWWKDASGKSVGETAQ